MATSIKVSIPHQLGRAEARRRLESGFSNLIRQVPGGGNAVRERWEGDRLTFSVGALGQTIAGALDVRDAEVMMEIELPGVLGMIAGHLGARLRKAGQLLLTKK